MKTEFQNKTYIDRDTGEIIETQTVVKQGDFDFHKIWLAHILDAIDEIGNSKMKVLMYLLKNMDSQNRYIGTITSIGTDTKTSRATVQRLLSSLEKCGIINRPQRGLIRISPKAVFKGGHSKRMNVLIKYREEQQMDLFDAIEDEKAA